MTRELLTPPTDKWVPLYAHEFVEGKCQHCGEDTNSETYDEYVADFYAREWEGEGRHKPIPEDEWEYLRDTCLVPFSVE